MKLARVRGLCSVELCNVELCSVELGSAHAGEARDGPLSGLNTGFQLSQTSAYTLFMGGAVGNKGDEGRNRGSERER